MSRGFQNWHVNSFVKGIRLLEDRNLFFKKIWQVASPWSGIEQCQFFCEIKKGTQLQITDLLIILYLINHMILRTILGILNQNMSSLKFFLPIGHNLWHVPVSAHQLSLPDCSNWIRDETSIRSFFRNSLKSSVE